MIISVTERGTFRRCRQQWDYASRNRQGLTPILPPLALSVGSVIHKALEQWFEDSLKPVEERHALPFYAVQESVSFVSTAKANYLARIGVDPDPSEFEGLLDQLELATHMLENYQTYHGTPLPEGYTLIRAEQTLLLPIPGTEHVCPMCAGLSAQVGAHPDCPNCNGTGMAKHYLEATLDGIAQDAQGQLWVIEHKTYGKRPDTETLNMNDQFIAYCWALQQLNLGPVGGILYDGMWKRRLDNRHGLNDLFLRTTLVRSPQELETFEKQLAMEAVEMAAVHDGTLGIYRNVPWMGCFDCSFRTLCNAEYGQDDAEFYRQRFTTREEAPWLTDQLPTED